jgi:hypothetical protein
MKISPEGWGVIADLLVNLAWFLLVSIPGYVMVYDWSRLTFTIIFFILATRVAIVLRQKAYDKSQ